MTIFQDFLLWLVVRSCIPALWYTLDLSDGDQQRGSTVLRFLREDEAVRLMVSPEIDFSLKIVCFHFTWM